MGAKSREKKRRWNRFLSTDHVLMNGKPVRVSDETIGCQEVWFNNLYTVFVRRDTGVFGPLVHLSIKRNDKEPIHDWRDLQRIKNELVGEEAEGIELYPAESRLVDTSNQYHLWVFPEARFPFGFDERLVIDKDLPVVHGAPAVGAGSKQRPRGK